MGISEIYAKEVHKELTPLYANWEPGQPVFLGDYGVLKDDILPDSAM